MKFISWLPILLSRDDVKNEEEWRDDVKNEEEWL
jgi:hypothetical protein